jgi:rhodanese-related sulfurtransferase
VSVKVPSNVDMADTILWGLTLRQLAILGGVCLVSWSGYLGLRSIIPAYGLAALGTLAAGAGLALAFARPDGLHAERWLLAGMTHMIRPRRRVLAPEGLARKPGGVRSHGRVAAFHLPVRTMNESGVVGLGGGRWILICRASALNLELRTASERESLMRGFGRFLNSLDKPVSLVVRSERSDLRAHIARIDETAPGLPHQELELAARAHSAFLGSLAERSDLLRREVYLVLCVHGSDEQQAAAQLRRRADDSAALLRSLGIRVAPLEGEDAASLMARAANPGGSLPLEGLSLPGEVVSGRPS